MQYLVAGIFKPGSDERVIALRNEFNEHLSQQTPKISLFGVLRDKHGKRTGYLAFISADSFREAEAYLERSPFFQNDLYERVEVAEFSSEVGELAE
jgi:uncharacterized protein YciI